LPLARPALTPTLSPGGPRESGDSLNQCASGKAAALVAGRRQWQIRRMNLVIPPLFFYVVGAMLVIFGAWRTAWLGRRHPSREVDTEVSETAAAAAAKARRRHLIFGMVWVALGLFLILSTAGVLHSRMPS